MDDNFILHTKKSLSRGWHIVVINKRGIKPVNHTLKLIVDYGCSFESHRSYDFLRRADRSLIVAVYILSPTKLLRLESSVVMPKSSFSIIRVPTPLVLFYSALFGLHILTFNHGFKYPVKKLKSIMIKYTRRDLHKKVCIYGHSRNWIRISYRKWIKQFEALHISEPAEQGKTKFSIILPVFGVDIRFLAEAINSVKGQLYSNWELCISGDASHEAQIRKLLKKEGAYDNRIKVNFRDTNGHMSKNSNDALALAAGDYCVLLDPDDLLRPHSLSEVYKVLENHPDVAFIYSDHDNIDVRGKRSCHNFKPKFNRDLFHAQNYINHLTVLKTSRLKEISGWREGYESRQDHDLYLRFLHGLSPNQITHIPKVLYHQRAMRGDAAMGGPEKERLHGAELKVLSEHFHGINKNIRVSANPAGQGYRVRYPIPVKPPLVSLIIPTKDLADVMQVCIESILEKTLYPNYEILIVNNNSNEDETFAFFEVIQRRSPRVKVIDYKGSFNYSAINNYAVNHARGEFIGLVNNDIEIINQEWLTEMVSHASRPDIGCVGAKLYYPNDTIQHAGIILGLGGVAGHGHKYYQRDALGYSSRLQLTQNLSAVTGALLIVEKSIFQAVGGLNEKHLKVAFNDVDLCLKVMCKGYRNLWTPYAEAYHHEAKSRGREDTPEKAGRFLHEIKYMRDTWADLIDHDPYYSPNLTRHRDDFSCRNETSETFSFDVKKK